MKGAPDFENPRPTYTDIARAYLTEGYRAWQARDGASADVVRDTMGLSVDEDMDFRRELQALDLIGGKLTSDDPGDFRLLPKGIALMDGSPTLDTLMALPAAALDRAAPSSEAAQHANGRWRSVVTEWAIKKGLDTVWENRQLLWSFLRMQFPWMPQGIPEVPL
jgi:hypothetical protein